MSKRHRPTYKTPNWASYNAALKRRGLLTIWFDPDMAWEATSRGKQGHQQAYSDVAIQTKSSKPEIEGSKRWNQSIRYKDGLCIAAAQTKPWAFGLGG